jgi:hypothetical protein
MCSSNAGLCERFVWIRPFLHAGNIRVNSCCLEYPNTASLLNDYHLHDHRLWLEGNSQTERGEEPDWSDAVIDNSHIWTLKGVQTRRGPVHRVR